MKTGYYVLYAITKQELKSEMIPSLKIFLFFVGGSAMLQVILETDQLKKDSPTTIPL